MADPATSAASVLAGKLSSGPPPNQDADRAVLRAVRLSLSRAAKQELSLQLAVLGVRQARQGQADLADGLNPSWLAILLDGPDQQPGALCLDTAFVRAVVQHQTMGKVLAQPESERRFTATDAAMTAPLIDAMLDQLGAAEDASDAGLSLMGFGFGARVASTDDLLLSLTAEWYRRFQVTADLGGGAVQGQMVLILPECAPSEDAQTDAAPAGPALGESFGVVRAELTAVLCRLRLPLNDLAGLRGGDVIPLPLDKFDQTELVTLNGEVVALCRLGQLAGMRAVRANETEIPPSGDAAGDETFQTPRLGPSNDPEIMPPDAEPEPQVSLPAQLSEPEDAVSLVSQQDLASEISRLAGLSGVDLDDPIPESGVEI